MDCPNGWQQEGVSCVVVHRVDVTQVACCSALNFSFSLDMFEVRDMTFSLKLCRCERCGIAATVISHSVMYNEGATQYIHRMTVFSFRLLAGGKVYRAELAVFHDLTTVACLVNWHLSGGPQSR